jgi:hypothetical protein
MPIEGLSCGEAWLHDYQHHFPQMSAPYRHVESIAKDIPIKRNILISLQLFYTVIITIVSFMHKST